MKRLLSVILASALLMVGCSNSINDTTSTSKKTNSSSTSASSESIVEMDAVSEEDSQADESYTDFDPNNFSDPRVMNYLEDNLYINLVDDFAKEGNYFIEEGNIYQVQDILLNKTAMRKMVAKVKVKNLRTGAVTEMARNSGYGIETIRLEKRQMQYLYDTGDSLCFMDQET